MKMTLPRQRTLLRLALIGGLPLLSLLGGWLVGEDRKTLAALLVIGLFGLLGLTLLRHIATSSGVIAIMLAGTTLNFFTIPTGTESRIVLSLVVALGVVGMWVAEPILLRKPFVLRPSPLNRPILLFVGINLLAFAWSILLRDPLVFVPRSFPLVQGAAMLVNVLLPLLTLLVVNVVQEVRQLKAIAWTMIVLGTFVITANLLRVHQLDELYYNGFGGLFATWVVVLATALLAFDKTLNLAQRLWLVLLIAGWGYRNVFVGYIWLSGWVPLVFAATLVIYLRSRTLFVMALLLFALYMGVEYNYIYQRVYVENVDEGGLQRLDLWRISMGHVANHWLFGMGPAGYAVYNMTYNPLDARSTHNNYFDLLAQTGVVGVATFLWLMGSSLLMGWRSFRRCVRRTPFEAALAAATLAGWIAALVAMMLGDWVLPFAYNGTIAAFDHAAYTWIFLGAMASLARLSLEPASEAQSAPTLPAVQAQPSEIAAYPFA